VPFEKYNIINRRFHMAYAALTGNSLLMASLESFFGQNFKGPSREFYNMVKGDMHKNHRALIKALIDRDSDATLDVLREELRRTEDNDVVWY
jgi:DNA-binding GntR family transcriptional regulator